MYKYINIVTIAIFFMSIYILYATCKVNRLKKGLLSVVVIATIIAFKLICMLGDIYVSKLLKLSYICEMMMILFAMQLNFKDIEKKSINSLFNINYFLGVFCLLAPYIKNINLYVNITVSFMITSSLYLFFLYINKSCLKKVSTKFIFIQVLYYIYFLVSLISGDKYKLIHISEILDLVLSIYIFNKNFKAHIKVVCIKEKETLSKLGRTKMTIKMHDEKLNQNKKFSNNMKKSLKRKQYLLDLILDQSNKCVLLIDNEGYILNEDNGFSKMWKDYSDCKYRISVNKFLNKNIKNIDEVTANIIEVNQLGKEIYGEMEGKDGRFFECMYAPFDIDNKRMGTICVITDITYKKMSKIQIKENEVKYKKIVENIPHSILVASDNEIIYNNGKNQDINLEDENIKNIIIEKSTNGELHYTYKNGIEVCLNIDRVEYLESEENRSLVVIRDITNYKKLLKDIEYSKRRYEALVNIIPEGIYILNYENKLITYANSTFLDLVGFNNIEEVNIDSMNEDIIITSGNVNDSIKFKRNTIKNKYGDDVDIECGGMLIDINKKLKMVGIVRDITDQLKTEMIEKEIFQKEKENRVKTEFFINMSHELKTPLNVIYSSNQLLESVYRCENLKNPDSNLSKAIKVVEKQLRISMGLIDSIMDLVKLESDFHEINKDFYNIVNMTEDLVTEFNKSICANGISIVFDTDEEEKTVNIDPNDFENAIFTFLAMAIRYSLPKSVINLDLNNTIDKSTIIIKNKFGFNYDKYINDNERKILDMRIDIAKLIIDLYGGQIQIDLSSKKILEIKITINSDEEVRNYKRRLSGKNYSSICDEYRKICSF